MIVRLSMFLPSESLPQKFNALGIERATITRQRQIMRVEHHQRITKTDRRTKQVPEFPARNFARAEAFYGRHVVHFNFLFDRLNNLFADKVAIDKSDPEKADKKKSCPLQLVQTPNNPSSVVRTMTNFKEIVASV